MPNYDKLLKDASDSGKQFFKRYPHMLPLLSINPTHEDGNCEIIAKLVNDFLGKGITPDSIKTLESTLTDEEWDEALSPPELTDEAAPYFGQHEAFFQDLKDDKKFPTNTVYYVDTEDHSYNFIKIDKDLYLIDASFGIYKQIESIEDLKLQKEDFPQSTQDNQFAEYERASEENYMKATLNSYVTSIGEEETFDIAKIGSIKPTLLSTQKSAPIVSTKEELDTKSQSASFSKR